MTEWGYTLSSEEHPPRRLVSAAVTAEKVGFDFCSISDHFHPWVQAQGHSPPCGRCSARSPASPTASRSSPA